MRSTLLRVSALTCCGALNARDTVATDTPIFWATCWIFTGDSRCNGLHFTSLYEGLMTAMTRVVDLSNPSDDHFWTANKKAPPMRGFFLIASEVGDEPVTVIRAFTPSAVLHIAQRACRPLSGLNPLWARARLLRRQGQARRSGPARPDRWCGRHSCHGWPSAGAPVAR
jgi:hypothetical protein